jgi:hypothetical protein
MLLPKSNGFTAALGGKPLENGGKAQSHDESQRSDSPATAL